MESGERSISDRIESLYVELATLTDEGPGVVLRHIAMTEMIEAESVIDYIERTVHLTPELVSALAACRRGEHRE